MSNTLGKKMWGGGTAFHRQHYRGDFCKRRGTDGGTKEKPALRGAAKGVGFTRPCQHSDRRSFTVSCMKCTPNPYYAYSGGIVLSCVWGWVSVHESARLINHWNPRPISLSQAGSSHAWYQRAGPEPSGWINRPIAAGRRNKDCTKMKNNEGKQNALVQ